MSEVDVNLKETEVVPQVFKNASFSFKLQNAKSLEISWNISLHWAQPTASSGIQWHLHWNPWPLLWATLHRAILLFLVDQWANASERPIAESGRWSRLGTCSKEWMIMVKKDSHLVSSVKVSCDKASATVPKKRRSKNCCKTWQDLYQASRGLWSSSSYL